MIVSRPIKVSRPCERRPWFGNDSDGKPPRRRCQVVSQFARPGCVPEEFRTSRSFAVDGTDVGSWEALQGDAVTVDLDGEAGKTQLMDDGEVPKPKKAARKPRVFGVGADGRRVYTADPDARGGHRSATNSRSAGSYVGYVLRSPITRPTRWTAVVRWSDEWYAHGSCG